MKQAQNQPSWRPSASVIRGLPESIRGHRLLVDFTEWLMLRYPGRQALNARIRERLEIDAA